MSTTTCFSGIGGTAAPIVVVTRSPGLNLQVGELRFNCSVSYGCGGGETGSVEHVLVLVLALSVPEQLAARLVARMIGAAILIWPPRVPILD
jgi:hypothetical protein